MIRKSVWTSRPFRIATTLLFAMPLSFGCSGIKKKRESDFLKPLASSTADVPKIKPGAVLSERSLCIRTAKTVAGKGHATEAIKLYEHAEQLDPNALPLNAELAPLYAAVGNRGSAVERYRRCIEDSPEDTELSNNFAWTLMEAERYDQAITEANRGLQSDHDNVRLLSTLAMIHYRKGDRDQALQLFKQTLGSSAAHHNLAILDIDAGNLDAAKKHLQIAKQSAEPDSRTELLVSALESQGLKR